MKKSLFASLGIVSLLALTTSALVSSTALVAHADGTLLTTIKPAANCTGLTWKIAYLSYYANDKGGTLPRDASVAKFQTELQKFVDFVATNSTCAMSVVVDVIDMGDAIFTPIYGGTYEMPSEIVTQAWRANGYDSVFFRFPDSYNLRNRLVGLASVSQWASFPVSASDVAGYSGTPWISVLVHEWLHLVVFNLKGRSALGLPKDDVHFNFNSEARYAAGGYAAAMLFYGDLIAGTVPEQGVLRGIGASDLLAYGTPRAPVPVVTVPPSSVPQTPTTTPVITRTPTTLITARGLRLTVTVSNIARGKTVTVLWSSNNRTWKRLRSKIVTASRKSIVTVVFSRKGTYRIRVFDGKTLLRIATKKVR